MKLELSNLAQGIKEKIKEKLGVADNATLILSEKRQSVCQGCEHKKFEKIFQADVCNDCGCILTLKALSDSQCPLGKWDNLTN